jgi:hypothetical protein
LSIVFSALSPSAPDNYLSDKLKACRMNPSASQIEQIKESIGKTELPLTQESELPAFTDAQSNVIEIYKQEVLDNLSEMLPPVDGEDVEATSFSLLTGDFQDYPANTPVLTVNTNYSTLNYLFTGYRVENGVLKERPPSMPPPEVASGLGAALGDVGGLDIGDLIGSLANAIASDGLSWVVGKLSDYVYAQFFKSTEVQELEKYVKQAIEENDISKASTQLQSVLHWLANNYLGTAPEDMYNDLSTQVMLLSEVVIAPLPRYVAALPVYAVAAGTALLMCRKMDELQPDNKVFPLYAPQYINELTQLLRDAFAIRAGYVTLEEDAGGNSIFYVDNFHYQTGPSFSFPPCKPGLYGQVVLKAEHSKVAYIRDTLYADFAKTYGTCINAVENWAKANNQAVPRFSYGDRLYGATNDYIPQGLGIVSAQGKYCLLYYKPLHGYSVTQFYDDNESKLVIFSVADGKPVWKTGSASGGWRAYMQQDRNFVVYSDVPDTWKNPAPDQTPNTNIWDIYAIEKADEYYSANSSPVFSSATNISGVPPQDYYIVMQDDGNLVIYPTGSTAPVWASNSAQ